MKIGAESSRAVMQYPIMSLTPSLAFGMQMALIIVTGHALASSPPVKRILRLTASLAKTPVQGVMLVTFFGSVACVINWGFGLVVGAMFARDNNVRVTAADRLCAQRNTLQAGAAHFIDGESTGAFRYTAAQQDLARRVLSESGL